MSRLSLLLSSLLLTSTLFTGCREPLTPEKFNSEVSDKSMSTAFWKYFDKGSYWSKRYAQNALFVNEKLSSFSPVTSTLETSYTYAQEKASLSDIYKTYQKAASDRGNKIGIYTGSFNAKMMKIKLNQQTLPTRYDDKIYYFDATPLYAEFDSNDNLISIMLSYTETYVAFNQFGNPMAPAEITLKTELFFGPKLLPFKNAISKKDWNDNLVNMITPELKNNI